MTPEQSAAERAPLALAEAGQIERVVGTVSITTAEGYDAAGEICRTIKARRKAIDDERKGILAPLAEATKRINALFKPAIERYDAAERQIKGEIVAYQQRLHAERVAAMVAREPDVAPPPVEARGVSIRTLRRWRVVDAAAVPRELCSPDLAKIEEHLMAHGEAPGVEWYEEQSVTIRQ